MKIFLAGCENWQFAQLPVIAKHYNLLFSYFHWSKLGQKDLKKFDEVIENPNLELICDSGLFTLMFGAGKGGSYDFEYMKAYTKTYIDIAKTFKAKITFVESDVHKLLGMKAVFELRKLFEDSGLKVLYVWHREEGIEGLLSMAKKYDYIAISVPELRILCKDKIRYQDAVKDLERKIVAGGRVPKIHLLGNTVMETMQTNISYSCDSTSWLSGGRYGMYIHYSKGRLQSKPLTSDIYLKTRHLLKNYYFEEFSAIEKAWSKGTQKRVDYMTSMYLSAHSFKLYQDFLDTKNQCITGVK